MTGHELRTKRVQAGVSGSILCARARVDRARLSNIENGHVIASASEMTRLDEALAALTQARRMVVNYAAEQGWPISAL